MEPPKKKLAIHQNRPYQMGPYNLQWPILYRQQEEVLRKIFGNEIILIEHIGSTSVEGMWAKPQIDILITVKDLKKIHNYYAQMEENGYTPRGDYTGEGEEYFTKDSTDGNREVSIHILPDGHRWAIDLLDVRDYLREHPEERDFYSNVKREVKEKYPNDYTNYYKTKAEAIKLIRKRAAEWRQHPW